MSCTVRSYRDEDESEVLRLNLDFEHFLSPMNEERFAQLRNLSALLVVAEHDRAVVGFLMGFVAGVSYDSLNYQWFSAHTNNFFYVDRVVVSASARGLGVGDELYSAAKLWARAESLDKMVAEIDIEPPNEVSLSFHKKHGFSELATRKLAARKVVSLQSLELV